MDQFEQVVYWEKHSEEEEGIVKASDRRHFNFMCIRVHKSALCSDFKLRSFGRTTENIPLPSADHTKRGSYRKSPTVGNRIK